MAWFHWNGKLPLIAGLLLILFCLGLGMRPSEPELTVSLFIPKETYQRGEPIYLTIIATNEGRDTISTVYSSSQSFDFAVFDQKKREIWRWSHEKVFAMMVRPFELPPGKELRFSTTWEQKDNYGNPVPKGKYFIRGWLTLLPRKASPQKQLIIN